MSCRKSPELFYFIPENFFKKKKELSCVVISRWGERGKKSLALYFLDPDTKIHFNLCVCVFREGNGGCRFVPEIREFKRYTNTIDRKTV